jgi:N-acetylneuraminate synthase
VIKNNMDLKFIAEIGINHNGSVENAKKLITIAKNAGANIVKFQKREPDICVPDEVKNRVRSGTPWGDITYLEYRHKVEFGEKEYNEIDCFCKKLEIDWTASAWDVGSQEFLRKYDLKYNKISSPMLTNIELVRMVADESKHTFVSTGMSTLDEIDKVVEILKQKGCPFELMHCNSSYPMPPQEANLRCIPMLRERYNCDVGYSGHEPGVQISLAAVVFGITSLERHITLDRSMWGSDQAASLERHGIEVLVRDTKIILMALGDGEKRIYPGELKKRKDLRGY